MITASSIATGMIITVAIGCDNTIECCCCYYQIVLFIIAVVIVVVFSLVKLFTIDGHYC